VLDAVDARRDTLLHGRHRVGVADHRESEPVCLVDDGIDLGQAELARADVGVWRHHPTAGHDLHQVRAPLGALPNRAAQLVRSPGRTAHAGAVAADAGDGWARGDHSRAVRPVPVPVDDRPILIAQIPDRRHARGQLRAERRVNDRVQLIGRQAG
jgi:hypothetical protein